MSDDGLTAAQRSKLRKVLESTIAELEAFLDEGGETRKPVDLDEPIGRVSRGDALQQQQMALASARHAKQRITALKAALQRIDDEDFACCVECGEAISFKRLLAVPEARLCIECKS